MPQLHSKCHTGIQHIVEFEPITSNFDLTRKAGCHVKMYSQLYALIECNQEQCQQEILVGAFLNHIKKYSKVPTNRPGPCCVCVLGY